MTYEVRIERLPRYLHATVTGTNSVAAVSGYLDDIAEACEKQVCFRVLIHEQLEGERLGWDEVFSIASEGAMKSMGMFHAIAYVDEQMGDMSHFAETVALNRGMPVRTFDNVADAEKWLLGLVEGPDEQRIFLDEDPTDA